MFTATNSDSSTAPPLPLSPKNPKFGCSWINVLPAPQTEDTAWLCCLACILTIFHGLLVPSVELCQPSGKELLLVASGRGLGWERTHWPRDGSITFRHNMLSISSYKMVFSCGSFGADLSKLESEEENVENLPSEPLKSFQHVEGRAHFSSTFPLRPCKISCNFGQAGEEHKVPTKNMYTGLIQEMLFL